MTRRRYLLSFRPAKLPKWWPRDGRKKFTTVGVLRGSFGWVLGDGSLMTLREIEDAKKMILVEWPDAVFVVRKTGVSR